MAIEAGSVDHISQIVSQVIGPSFLLGAVASFISILIGRLNGVLDRLRVLNSLPDGDRLKADVPRLRRRTKLIHRSIEFAIASGIAAAFLIVISFVMALLGYQHAWVAAVLFVISLSMLCAALVVLAGEVRIGLTEHDHF